VIAAFAVDKGLIDKDLYSSIVLAILLSTIIAPFSLRFTISYFNKKAMAEVLRAEEEMNLKGVDDVLTVCFELYVCFPCHDHVYYTRCTNRFYFFVSFLLRPESWKEPHYSTASILPVTLHGVLYQH
jgi:hypothetical protein